MKPTKILRPSICNRLMNSNGFDGPMCVRHLSPVDIISHRLSHRSALIDRALSPFVPRSAMELATHMSQNVIYNPVGGDVLALEKPYGVSCLGYVQQGRGVFGDARERDGGSPKEYGKRTASEPTVDDALPHLRNNFQQPGLHFCIGLKRWVSGPLLLPATPQAFKRIVHSTFIANSNAHSTKEKAAKHIYRALAICVSRPAQDRGTTYGYVTFQKSQNASEYIFMEGEINVRARKMKYAHQGEITYEVLESKHGLSLIDLHFSKFSMHYPRVYLSFLGAPIFGDQIYMRRLLDVDGKAVLVDPKDLARGGRKYEPVEFLRLAGLKRMEELKPAPPIYLAVYQTTLPAYGDTKSARRVTELRLKTPPPEHFLAMIELLDFKPALARLLNTLEDNESREQEERGKQEQENGQISRIKEQKTKKKRKPSIVGGEKIF